MRMLVTGGAGFIGSTLVKLAISKGLKVKNVDSLTYSGSLANVACVEKHPNYTFENINICNQKAINAIFKKYRPDYVAHLAAERQKNLQRQRSGEKKKLFLPKLATAVDDKVFRKTGEVNRTKGGPEQNFSNEVTITNSIHRVEGHFGKTQLLGKKVPDWSEVTWPAMSSSSRSPRF